MKMRFCAVVFSVLGAVSAAAQQDLDVVLAGGRVLDPETGLDAERDVGISSGSIRDTADFEGGDLTFSEGVVHVLVNGVFVVRDSQSVRDVFPGKPVLGRYMVN